jgi:DNA-binding NtrC family response regulator
LVRSRILLVDDDESVLFGLKGILEAQEFEVTTASNVIEALTRITSESFDVVLTDLHMPDPGDGLIVASAMRQANPKAVTIILSANPDMRKAVAAILRQADKIMLKPVNAGFVVRVIRERLAQQEPHLNRHSEIPDATSASSVQM